VFPVVSVAARLKGVIFFTKENRMLKYLVLITGLTLPAVVGAQPINDIEEFQSRIDKCIKGASADVCLNKLLPQHYPPGNEEMLKTIPQVTSMLVKWLDGDKVYAIHPIKNTKVGSLHERRIHVIEGDKGGFMVLETSYVRLHGNLYLLKFNLSSTKETIDALFKDKL
jgi:hypothetical protein